VLSKYAKLNGDIISSRLIIEDGAVFEGKSTMIPAPNLDTDQDELFTYSNG